MVNIVRDVQYLAKPKWQGNLTVVTVSDPWLRHEVSKLATDLKGYDIDNLGEVTDPARILMAAVTLPLIGDPLIVATLDRKATTSARLPGLITRLAEKAQNKTVVLMPWASDFHETAKEDTASYTIIRESDLAKKNERNALIDKVLSTLKPVQLDVEPWHSLLADWYKQGDAETLTPTALRLAVDYAHALSVDTRGVLDTVQAVKCLQHDDTSTKYPDILTHMASIARSPNQRGANMLLQQIAMHTTDDTEKRKLAAAIELTALEVNTNSTTISQSEDPKTHAYKRSLIQQSATLTLKQMIRLNMLAQRLAAAIRQSNNPLAKCAAILNEHTQGQ